MDVTYIFWVNFPHHFFIWSATNLKNGIEMITICYKVKTINLLIMLEKEEWKDTINTIEEDSASQKFC